MRFLCFGKKAERVSYFTIDDHQLWILTNSPVPARAMVLFDCPEYTVAFRHNGVSKSKEERDVRL